MFMNFDWLAWLSQQQPAILQDGCSGATASKTALENDVVCPLPDLGLLQIAGADALTFLHNLATHDIKNLSEADFRFAGLCTPKGRLFASFHVWRQGERLMVLLARDIAADTLARLQKFVLRSKAALQNVSDEYVCLGFTATESAAKPDQTVPLKQMQEGEATGVLMQLDARRRLLATPATHAPYWWKKLVACAQPAHPDVWRWLEIAAGQPRVVAATQELFIPQMLNFDLPGVNGVSFNKGCYPGQEIVARAHYLGKIKRRMTRGRIAADKHDPRNDLIRSTCIAGAEVFAPETGAQCNGHLALAAPSPDGGQEFLLVAAETAIAAGDLRVGAVDGPAIELLPLPYSLAAAT